MLYEKKQDEGDDADDSQELTQDAPAASVKEDKASRGRQGKTAAKTAQKTTKKKVSTAEQRALEKKRQKDLNRVRKTLNQIIEKYSDDDNWIRSSRLAEELQKRMPEFDVRNFGFNKFSSFIKSLGTYEWDEQETSNGRREIRFRLKDYMKAFV